MERGFTRREAVGVGAMALAATSGTASSGPAWSAPSANDTHGGRQVERLAHWRFHLGHAAQVERDFGFGRDQRTYAKAGAATADAAMAKFDDAGWQQVQVPHDWAVALPFAPPAAPPAEGRADAMAAHGFKAIGREFPQHSVGWYRCPINVGAADRGRRLWLEFDGVFRDSLVFVNGYVAGRSESGYAPFRVEIDDYLDYDGGPNMIAVRCDASLGEGWFYEGAGIYRHVDLVRADPLHIPQWGSFIRSQIGPDGATVRVATDVRNSGAVIANAILRQAVIGDEGRFVSRLPDVAVTLEPDQMQTFETKTLVATPTLWSIEKPTLYTMRSEIWVGDRIVDRYETRFGIRSIRFDAARGFFLNGKPVKLLGTCNHHDHAGVGTGIADALHAFRVARLQSMGSNAWRSAHNPPAAALLDICDATGMLMIDEARINGTDDEAIGQLDRIVRRDRNHPCIILWSLGNEEPHQGSERGARITQQMAAHVRRLDPTRLNSFALDNGWDKGIGRVVDTIGFNYRTDKIEGFHAAAPTIPVYGSETGSTVATRGEYANDKQRQIVRAYDTEHPWWASTAEAWWTIVADRPYIAGGFIWTGFDYRGEPTPYALYPSISSYFGVLDTCGFAKDNHHYYRAWWRPDLPQVHILPHWTWPGREGQPIEVWVYGNGDEVELRLNGRSLGRKRMPRNRHLEWSVPFAPGTLEAISFRAGREVARSRQRTAGPAARIALVTDRRMVGGSGRDVVIVDAHVLDRRGTLVPAADNLLSFAVNGGSVIGVGNGNPTSTEPDVANHRRAFNGLAQAIVRVAAGTGPVTMTANSPGLSSGKARVFASARSFPKER